MDRLLTLLDMVVEAALSIGDWIFNYHPHERF